MFDSSLLYWHNMLAKMNGQQSLIPRLYLGGLSFENNESGYLRPEVFEKAVRQVSAYVNGRFGGVMLWDATHGLDEVTEGRNFLKVAKDALVSANN